jgi:hypothetical protein
MHGTTKGLRVDTMHGTTKGLRVVISQNRWIDSVLNILAEVDSVWTTSWSTEGPR